MKWLCVIAAVLLPSAVVDARPPSREGSLLVKNPPFAKPVDTRGGYEKRLALELEKHVRRMARLARIGEVAKAEGDDKLATEVDAVRRRELARHSRAMTWHKAQARARRVVGFP